MQALYRCIAGMDVHRMLYVLTVLVELADGTEEKHQRSFGGFKRDRRALVTWLLELGVDLVVMESTGIYWKSIYSTLEKAGIPACPSSMPAACQKRTRSQDGHVRFRMADPISPGTAGSQTDKLAGSEFEQP